MTNSKTSTLSNGFLWFGAAVSIAEILTGTLIAPLGFFKGTIAIILGHFIGCILLYLIGLIGAKTDKTAMESVSVSFGSKGSNLFSVLNIVQLIGWTAVMIISSARAISTISGDKSELIWCAVIGAIILIWIVAGIKNISKINYFAVGALFILTIVLSFVVFGGGVSKIIEGEMTFGSAVELSATMPLSWLPLIADYLKQAKNPKAATLSSTVFYFAGSCWMYIIGLGAALFTGESDVAKIMLTAGLGIFGIITILLSTVTTTYLDVYSAGVSYNAISKKTSEKKISIIVCILGTLVAMFTPIEQYQSFLYLIGSVFAPMCAILITDVFILKKDNSEQIVNITNIIIWIIGFTIYRLFMTLDTVVGSTLPVMTAIVILCILIHGGKKLCLKKS